MARAAKPAPPQATLDVVMVPVGRLRPSEYNPRKMTEKEAENLEASIRSFGFVEPLVVNEYPGRENVVIGGHQRLALATLMGVAEVPCVFVNVDERREQELNLRLNKNTGAWDYDMLASFPEDLLAGVGFTAHELGLDAFPLPDDGNTAVDQFADFVDPDAKEVTFKLGPYMGRIGRDVFEKFERGLTEARDAGTVVTVEDYLALLLGGVA